MSSNYLPVRESWLAQHHEDILDPQLPIIDAHHHFYDRPGWTYLDDAYRADACSGHRITASVYMQAQTRYHADGPEAMRPVGETAYVASIAEQPTDGPRLAGIVGHANLRAGASVRAVLEAHLEAGKGLFKGIRHLSTWDADTSLVNPLSAAPQGLLLDAAYRAGVAELGALGLSYDAWLFFHQLPELFDLAKAYPDLPVIINHCGGVVRIASYQSRRQEVFDTWSRSMRALAQLPNVYVKLGGLGMRINGFDFEKADLPPDSTLLAQTWRPWMDTCIDAFGAERCMFESNFPVDKGSYAYATVWNAFKRLAAGASADERTALFSGTARQVYRLA